MAIAENGPSWTNGGPTGPGLRGDNWLAVTAASEHQTLAVAPVAAGGGFTGEAA